jgi:hypothetical protein
MQNDDDESAAAGRDAKFGTVRTGRLGAPVSVASLRRKPRWRWLSLGLLLIFSVAVTGLYAASVTTDISRHHWAAVLDASRDAVPAVVGWAAVLIVLFAGGRHAALSRGATDDHAVTRQKRRVSKDTSSVLAAEQRVSQLTARLDELTIARHAATRQAPAGNGPAPPADLRLQREVAETTARLEQARQWLTSARAALSGSQDQLDAARERLVSEQDEAALPGPHRRRPAG